jgi:hypothetical protein
VVVVGTVAWFVSPSRGLRDITAFLILTGCVMWVSWWPRLVIEAEGVRLFSILRPRFVAWDEIERVRLGALGISSGQGVLLTVAGKDVGSAVPSIGIVGGQRYTQDAVEDVRAAWHEATAHSDDR